MKQLACSAIGGPSDCHAMVSGNDVADIGKNGMAHLESAHPELAAQVKAMSPEQMEKWAEETQPKFDAAPIM